jgi:hypothetical protein
MKKANNQEIHFSGFCATDNKNFALFDVSEHFLVDNDYTPVLDFKLSENDLSMIIDRNNQIKVSKGNLKVTFTDYGLVDRKYFNLFISINSNCKFYPVTEWFGTKANRLIAGLPEKAGKPIGVLKTVT